MSDLLDEGMELDAAARERWLENLSPQNQDLAEALREALFPTMGHLDVPAALTEGQAGGRGERPASDLAPGQRVGPYQLERLLGSGGMAEVWLAKRADGAFKRQVALKLPMVSRMRKDLEGRFIRERDILASLEHPNIARLYDAGIDAQGLPYLSMEYVPGQPFIAWCDAHKLGIRERLRLFLHVLEAVEYAHQKQVIHRDLKPSNILVTESGQVRLLDFGVAKLLEDTDRTQLTRLYGRALTPDYASPEQLRGNASDARSDIYSLGVLLYELLTGRRPYALKAAASVGSLEQAIATVELKRPSMQLCEGAAADRGTTQQKLAQELRGDLDVIALKVLAKEPGERYESAAAMAEDLERYLEHRPVQARPAPITLRVKKFVVRHRPVIAVSALASVLLLAIGSYEIEYRLAGPSPAPVPAFNPPRHSIAVLPFVNLSGDKEQEYFSDGVSEELLNSLARINELQVAARTSAFSFKGKDMDIGTIARQLNVATVLEGSVRRSRETVRITAQLINAATGYHLWSQTYDRPLGDVLALQTDIANAVAAALQITLLGDLAGKIELGGTHNPGALDAYLAARRTVQSARQGQDYQSAIAAYSKAISIDPQYALAYAHRSAAYCNYAVMAEISHAMQRQSFAQAQLDARQAISLAPDLAEAHVAMGYFLESASLDFGAAHEEYERAIALAPGNAWGLRAASDFLGEIGHFDEAIAASRRTVDLDPLNPESHYRLGKLLYYSRRYKEAVVVLTQSIDMDSSQNNPYGFRGLALYAIGDLDGARASCEPRRNHWMSQLCLSMVYEKLNRHADAQVALSNLKAGFGEQAAYQFATISAQWGNTSEGLKWLETAVRLHDPGLVDLKVDPLLDPLRREPRFQAILERLRFPQ